MRVLQVINLSDHGGAERYAVGLATHLPRDRFEPWICSPRVPGEQAALALREADIPLVCLGREAKWDVHHNIGLAGLLRRERFDVLHAHMFGSNLWGTIVGRSCRVPVVIAHEHTWSYEGNPMRAWLDGRVIGRLATRFIAVSVADAERMVKLERVPPAKVLHVPTAYLPHGESSGRDLRAELGLPPDTLLVGTVALMRPQKALHVLIGAHERVLATFPDAHLVIVGDGPCRAELEHLVAELSLQDRVHLLGRRTDIDSIVRQLDVATISSDFEGMPMFALECMANGTPLVATAVGGLPEIIDHGRTGILVPPRSSEQLADAVTSLLADRERRERLAAAAAQRLEGYTIDAIAARFADLYESLVREADRCGA